MALHRVRSARGTCSFGVLHRPWIIERTVNRFGLRPGHGGTIAERRDRAGNERPADHQETPGELLGCVSMFDWHGTVWHISLEPLS